MHKRQIPIIYAVILLAVAGVIGWRIGSAQSSAAASVGLVTVRENSPQYKFTNPLLFNDTSKDLFNQEFQPLNDSLHAFISDKEKDGTVDAISAYFRYLNSGHWTGINEDEKYEPSSMLKVLVMMAALKLATDDPNFLLKQLSYSGPDSAGQYYKPSDGLTKGSYSIETLIGDMIIYSDNGADEALLSDPQINQEFQDLSNTFHLPLRTSVSGPVPDFMSAKSYSVLFRALYNGSIFSADLCERILSLLASTTFKHGLVAGVPPDTVVSHKFGENTNYDPSTGGLINRELHDCGIVYYPKHPYLLCVMTKGDDFSNLESVISGLSKITYNFVQHEMASN